MEALNKILEVTNYELDEINMNYINTYNFFHDVRYFGLPSGKEQYRLLTYISNLFSGKVLYDIGTHRCMSAAALSSSIKNKVKTYDIVTILPVNPFLPYVEYIIGDVTEDEKLINSPFIFFDVDHDGIFEKKLYEHLQKINYKGLLMCDDIHQEGDMVKWWDTITHKKYDLTEKGHWNGTGLIHFS